MLPNEIIADLRAGSVSDDLAALAADTIEASIRVLLRAHLASLTSKGYPTVQSTRIEELIYEFVAGGNRDKTFEEMFGEIYDD